MPLKRVIQGYKAVNEFLGDLVDAVKDTPWPEAVAKAVPWLGYVGEGLADSVAPIKFVVKLYESATRIDDPQELGEIACTVAFQRSVQQSLSARGLAPEKKAKRVAANAADDLRKLQPAQPYDFTTMTLEKAIQEPFFLDASGWLRRFLELTGVIEKSRNALLTDVERRFTYNLELLLTSRDTQTKFEPFYRLLVLDKPEQRAYRALRQHAAYQRWMYEERRILREEPYALQHTYVRTDCGDLKWGDFEQRRKERAAGKSDKPEINAFLDDADHGGRHDVLETVLRHLSDPTFCDLLVIQGPAGTGKSSFTLRLCQELMAHELLPIRVELKHLDTTANRHVSETLPEAVRLADEDFDPTVNEYTYSDGLFLDDAIFGLPGSLNGTQICRYVLILDAWDEISIGAEEGYQQHVERLLKEIRDTYLDNRRWKNPVRVILTGRPTEAVTQGRLMRDDTRLLTLRYFTVEQLEQFHRQLASAVRTRPIRSPEWMEWKIPDAAPLAEVRDKYRESLGAAESARHSVELLGSPLLGLLSLRLLSQWPGDPKSLFDSPTVLYRSLVDLLLGGGKAPTEKSEQSTAHITGRELRELLWGTAEALTVLGREGLPKAELLKRVKSSAGSLDERVSRLIDINKLSRLMVSFFFHGGRAEQGCEFSHKSFREYLFSECVVEELKNYARNAQPLPERDLRCGYWREFDKRDARYDFSRRIARLLGPQWLTREVRRHITDLIEWELQRSMDKDPFPPVRYGQPTDALPLEKWALLRDTLADLWDWWGEAVHLRPQPYEADDSPLRWSEPVALEVVKSDRLISAPTSEIRPPRLTTVDSHLGDALFELCCDVHRVLIEHGDATVPRETGRRYQSTDPNREVRFRPSGPENYWESYWHRIEAAGYRWRFGGFFPEGIDLSWIDWRGAILIGIALDSKNLENADLSQANLIGAQLQSANLEKANLEYASLFRADFSWAILKGAKLERANLERALLLRADISGANLKGANLRGADLEGADLEGANLEGADLEGASLRGARIDDAQLSPEQLTQVKR